jgi:alcohol dehydrogenase, propanol-preferring
MGFDFSHRTTHLRDIVIYLHVDMRAMVLKQQRTDLVLEEVSQPSYGDEDILIQVLSCGVCRTDLHIQEGDLPHPKLPLILGHEIVGLVAACGKKVEGFYQGMRVGVPWLGYSCGHCSYCTRGEENLCDHALYTGYQIDGGYAEYAVCKARFAVPLPEELSDEHMAPLLCAGLIGYRAYRKAAPRAALGLYGFGAAAHIIAQLAIFEGKDVYAFTRDGDVQGQQFAREMGAAWAGDATAMPPVLLDAAILFAPVGEHVPLALKTLRKGGRCICGGIHMSDIPSFPYADLWEEKRIESTANLTRDDAREFFHLLSRFPLKTEVNVYPLERANQALQDLKEGKFHGAAVLVMGKR